ncbi:hypothetical protein GPECTOR_55g274 [Gonium pectorale]|uniref:Uncharacterized protein n=1 Tax=Gonium pectorale TaxID=33097 RepID=A0A150G6B6_GONPE|nr:hypothetical protein GPECTOR_55g274 [Gonium pectorale]|eukprot:KXZ45368.1 hypothetical protein GPECTOR_55g274 [Gonium pectorale]
MTDLETSIKTLLSAPAIKATDPCIVVGTKVRAASEVLNVEGVDTAFELGNAGREWAVYITYLISYYDNLPQHVLLAHGRINFKEPELMPRLALFGPSTGMLGIGTCIRCYWVLYRYVMHNPGHYLSADAHEQMQAAPKHSVNFVNHLGTCEDTLGGHIVERAWSFIFGCYQQPHREACTSFNGTAQGLNPTCAYNGWQCYDSMPPWKHDAVAP